MKGAQRRQKGRSVLDLIEEAVHLLRTAPAATLAVYYGGSLPFVLAVLYYWADMSRSPFARHHVIEAALGVTLLFFWMKFCHALFVRRLRAQCAGQLPAPLKTKASLKIVFTQATLHPSGLFLIPVSVILLPLFPWVYGFYQNLTALADAEVSGMSESIRRAARHTRFWPQQNYGVIICLVTFGFFVFLDCSIVCGGTPMLLHSLLGIDTVFSRSGTAMLNTTFFATMFAITYLCVDPIVKAIYMLRCFYGESIQTGADLRADLKRYVPMATQLAALLLLGFMLAGTVTARAEEPPTPPASSQGVSPKDLDQSIGNVIQQRKYAWRMPRERIVEPEGEEGVISKFFSKIGSMVRKAIGDAFEWIGDTLGKIFRKLFGGVKWSPRPGSTMDWHAFSQILIYVLVAILAGIAGVFLFRLWRNRQPKPEIFQAEAIQSVPDITDESIGADQLPEDGWTKMARELLARGEFRLALRAFYLASLAHLAEKNLISLARFKSNHDYERELSRRAHALPEVQQLFEQNVWAFDRVWYGTYQADAELVTQFATNVDRIKTGA